MAESEKRQYIVGVDFGTTYTGYAYATVKDLKTDSFTYCTAEWKGTNLWSKKAPTSIMMDENKQCVAFGYEADSQYFNLLAADEHTDYYYFTQFKQVLYNQILARTTKISDITGKEMKAIDVFSQAIQFVRRHIQRQVKQTNAIDLKDEELYFVLTVPSTKGDAAETFIKDAAKQAGLQDDNFCIAEEPIVSSMFCLGLRTTRIQSRFDATVKSGMKYMVIDLGGAYTDITVYQIQLNSTIQEVVPQGGGPWGGTSVDDKFITLLEDIFGETVMTRFKTEQLEDYIDLCRQFESRKRMVKINQENDIDISMPGSFISLLKQIRKMSIGEAAKQIHLDDDEIRCSGQKLFLPAKCFKRLFEQTLASLITSVGKILSNTKLSDLKTMIMVGGFSECELVMHAVKAEFGGNSMKIITPAEAGLAVVKGAVLYGHLKLTATTKIPELEHFTTSARPPVSCIKDNFDDRFANLTTSEEYTKKSRSARFTPGSKKDVTDLKCFFEKLNYKVLHNEDDMTIDELKQYLEEIRNNRLKKDSHKYHSFYCVIMSHGNETGIATTDGLIPPEEIVKFFRNNAIAEFIGKPKVFFFDMCRGSETHQKFMQIESESGPADMANARPSTTFLPNECDILVAYATTPGYQSFRKIRGNWTGSWFIQAFLAVAEGNLQMHLEDILKIVRRELSNNPTYELGGKKCMMPNSETKTTKNIYL
ncbi:unnamed protein product [Mytilus edulis]|uniref:Uncharacterized protein n=1 Tax=Mytilus edulis TaxID=6550 RepID=A0A8S3S9N1_MYTED|nr:unnamed protein product [Mytilus edulis]